MPERPNAPRLRALIYNRVSADPSGARVSVESQDHENRAFCERQGWDIVGTITDNDRSASRFAAKQREGYHRVLAAIGGNSEFGRVDVIVAWESSRGERRLDGYVTLRGALEANNVLYAYKGRVFDLSEGDDRFATGLDALLDEREAERARERTLRSHRTSVQRGTPRGMTPFGYRREYDPHSGRMAAQVPDPLTAPIVTELVDRILGGETLYAIAKDFNARGVVTPAGHRDRVMGRNVQRPGWTSSIIRNLLSKQTLMGLRTHHGVVTGDATWEGLVDPKDWAAVQAILADPLRSRNQRGVKTRHLLSGIAECGVCGAWLRPLRNRGRMTYACAGKTPTSGKGHVSRSQEALDAVVVAWLAARLERPDFLPSMVPPAESSRVGEHERQLADLLARQAEFEKAASQRSGAALESVLRVLDDLAEAIEQARLRTQAVDLPPVVKQVAGPGAADRFASLPLDAQRQVVRCTTRIKVFPVNGPRGSGTFDHTSVKITRRHYLGPR